jgi:hypothetical protein
VSYDLIMKGAPRHEIVTLWREVKEKIVLLSAHADECAAILRSSMVESTTKRDLRKR